MKEKITVNFIHLESVRRKQKRDKFKNKVKNGINKGLKWTNEHIEEIAVIAPCVLAGGKLVAKVVNKGMQVKKEQDLKELYCYDRSLGHYWRLRRELSNKEWLEIDRRKADGERLADILAELKVLK